MHLTAAGLLKGHANARLALRLSESHSLPLCLPCFARPTHAGANVTFWNLFSTNSTGTTQPQLPDCKFGPLLNFVGSWRPPKGVTVSCRHMMNAWAAHELHVPPQWSWQVQLLRFHELHYSFVALHTISHLAQAGKTYERYPALCSNTRWFVEQVSPQHASSSSVPMHHMH